MQVTGPQTVSIIIPAWNASRFIGRAAASALCEQENVQVQVREVIIVDDCSTDDTLEVLERMATTDPRLKVVRNAANLGPGGTRNAGIAAATGDWIAVLDADDAYAPGRLPRLIELATLEGLDIIADLPVLYDLAADAAAPEQLPACGRLQRLALADLLRPDAETGLDLGLLKPVFRRHLATEGLWRYPEKVRHGEDFALYFDLVGRGIAFGLLHEAFYVFSTRIGAISGSYSPGSVTSVDYRAIAAHAHDLGRAYAARPDADPDVQNLLSERQNRALRQNRIYGWTLLRKKEITRLRQWLLKDPRNIRDMLIMFTAKLMGHRGLPD